MRFGGNRLALARARNIRAELLSAAHRTTLGAIALSGHRIPLPDVTLVAVDTRSPDLALLGIAQSMTLANFGAAVLVTRPKHGLTDVPRGLRIVTTDRVNSISDYGHFLFTELHRYVGTSHCLIVQWDGFVLDPSMWDASFLQFDYIGPVWIGGKPGHHRVGGGGFSLRSRRLLLAVHGAGLELSDSEDICLCKTYREYLESRHGIRYADEATAHRFAFEFTSDTPPSFGFHGLANLVQIMSEDEVNVLLETGPDGVFTGLGGRQLIKTAVRRGDILLARRAFQRRIRARRLDLGDVRLWLRISSKRLSSRLERCLKSGVTAAT